MWHTDQGAYFNESMKIQLTGSWHLKVWALLENLTVATLANHVDWIASINVTLAKSLIRQIA